MSRLILTLNIFEWGGDRSTLIKNKNHSNKKKIQKKKNAPVEPFDNPRRFWVMYNHYGIFWLNPNYIM